jgi:hypothetical protein
MARARTRSFVLISWIALAGASSCMTDHDALEKQPNQGTGAGGAGNAVGFAGHAPISGGGNAVAGSAHGDDEAPGASVLTLVHGVVDAPSIVVCFAKVGSDGSATPFGKPLSPAPLAYGQSVVLPAISGADLAVDTLQPFVIAGELDLISELDCAAAVELARTEEAAANPSTGAGEAAGGSPGEAGAASAAGAAGAPAEAQARLRARGLPAIPPNTLNGGRSYALVAAGCMGGAGYSAAHAEDYCGQGYSERSPTVTEVFAALSRATSVSHVGLQLLHASLATDPISVSSVAAFPATDSPVSIAMNDAEGGLLPRPAYIAHAAFDYGSTRGFALQFVASREDSTQTNVQNVTLLTEPWTDVLALGGIPALEDGSNYTLVLIGPLADSKPGAAFWNRPAVTMVKSDPQ